LPAGRQRILLIVGSYDEAKHSGDFLNRLRSDWQGQVLSLVADDDEFESEWRGHEESLQRGLVHQFAETGAWILIAPLLAIERGHNILNNENAAAIGAAYFLVRPHPRPDDISFAIQSINRWALEHCDNLPWFADKNDKENDLTLIRAGRIFRQAAYKRWRFLLRLPMIYSTLPSHERNALTWSQLVTIWQVVGRLIRGGSPARIFFCDAPFARRTALQDDKPDHASSSLLVSIIQVLRPYFTNAPNITPTDRALVQALYGPFYQAISRIGGLPHVP